MDFLERLIVPLITLAAIAAAIVVIRSHLARTRRAKEVVWAEMICPRCKVPFGPEAARAATEYQIVRVGNDLHFHIRCLRCLRFYQRSGGGDLREIVDSMNADRLLCDPTSSLDNYGALKVVVGFNVGIAREDLEEHLKRVNPRLLERIEFVDSKTEE